MNINQLIARARTLDPKVTLFEDYRALFDQIAIGHIFATITPTDGPWFRVRANVGRALFESTKDLYYPPKESLRSFGRANEPNKPVLYLSEGAPVSLREAKFKDGDYLTIATYQPVQNSILKLQEVGISEYVSKGNFTELSRSLANNIRAAHRDGYGNFNNQTVVRNYFVQEFTRDVASGNEYEYKRSAALASLLLSRKDCDGIVYPAMRSNKADVNVVLKPASADLKLRMTNIAVVQAYHGPDLGVAVQLMYQSESIGENGLIHYRDARGLTKTLPWIQQDRPFPTTASIALSPERMNASSSVPQTRPLIPPGGVLPGGLSRRRCRRGRRGARR